MRYCRYSITGAVAAFAYSIAVTLVQSSQENAELSLAPVVARVFASSVGGALAGVTLVRLAHWRDSGSIPYYLRWIVASLVGFGPLMLLGSFDPRETIELDAWLFFGLAVGGSTSYSIQWPSRQKAEHDGPARTPLGEGNRASAADG